VTITQLFPTGPTYSYVKPDWTLGHNSTGIGDYSYVDVPVRSPSCSSDTSLYAKGTPAELSKHGWFYGDITEQQATVELGNIHNNGFLVRHSSQTLILSIRLRGWRKDYAINYSPEGYQLEGKDLRFKSVLELIEHYQNSPIDERKVLGMPCDKTASGIAYSYQVHWCSESGFHSPIKSRDTCPCIL
jgi:hypothetical protein